MVKALDLYMSGLEKLLKLSGMKTQQVEVEPGTTIHFWLPNRTLKTKPAVVFLHGFGSTGIQQWQFQVLSLATTYAVYVPDFLFFGGSTTDKPDRSPEFQAECVAKSLKKLGVDKCVLVGLSYGGMVGFKMAEMFPDLVKSMVASCSVMALTESMSSDALKRLEISSWSELLIPRTVEDVRKTFDIVACQLPWLPDIFFTSVFKIMTDNSKERAELLEALITKDKDFKIPYFSQKIHLLWGENDELFPMDVARNLEKQLKGKAELQCIKKAGHTVHLERPFAYNKQLKKILSSVLEDA
ncbi:alpha/beta-Hydrolases superfamily protein [Euphorbia peplus]|nr:alpha/beta-Hydrolases superfamily protein [Euphorbia peplus]